MKKLGIIPFLVLAILLLVSCGKKKENMPNFAIPTTQTNETSSDNNTMNQQSKDSTSNNNSITSTDNQEPDYNILIKNIDTLFPNKKIINWVMPSYAMTNVTEQQIIDFDNKLTSQANTDYVLQFVIANTTYDDYNLVIDKIISDGVNIDIFSTGSFSLGIQGNASLMLDPYSYFYNKGYLYKLDDYLLSKNGSKLYKSTTQKIWESLKINNSIYGINIDYYLNNDYTISIDKAIVTQYNIDLSKFTSNISSIEDAAKTITEATGVPAVELGPDLTYISDYLGYKYVCGTVVIDKETNKAVNLFETDKFKHYISSVRQFVQSGYIDPDKFHNIGNTRPIHFNSTNSSIFSTTVNTANLYPLKVSSPRAPLCIYKNASNPIDALDLLTLLHTNTEFADSLIYGKNDSTSIMFPWFSSLYLSTSIHSDEESGLRDRINTFNKGIELDRYSTYHFNTIPVEETLNNIDQILLNYINPIVDKSKTEKVSIYCSFITGHDENPMQTLDEINAKLKAAGLDTLIDAVNKSLKDK